MCGWADRHLRIANDTYDKAIRRFIPGYAEMIARAAKAVASVRPALVTDLGSGTGSLAKAVLDEEGVGVVELVDSDKAMLDGARVRLASFGNRARFSRRSFTDPINPCDAACASLALHHVPCMKAKTDLYRNIHDGLRPGGVFVNADAALTPDPDENRRIYEFWADHMVASGIESRERAFEHFAEWAEEDTYFTLDEELSALAEAGFDAECVWRCGAAAICVGRVGRGGGDA